MPIGDIVVLVLVLFSVGWSLWRRFAPAAEREVIRCCGAHGLWRSRYAYGEDRARTAPPTIERLKAINK